MSSNTITSRKGTKVHVNKRGYRYRAYKGSKQFYFPLGIYREDALKMADEIRGFLMTHSVEEARERFHPDYKPTVDTVVFYPRFRKFCQTKLRVALGLTLQTMNAYLGAFARISRFGLGSDDLEKFDVFKFDPEWFDALKVDYVSQAKDMESEVSRKRTCNSLLRNMQSLFSESALEAYQSQKKWVFPFAEGVAKIKPFKRVKKMWVAPNDVDVAAVHKCIEGLDGDLYIAAMLALHAGLRYHEIKHCSRDWLQFVGGEIRLWVIPSKEFQQKGRPGYTILRPEIYHKLDERSLTDSGRFLKQIGRKTVFTPLRQVLRSVLDVEKPVHELRRLFGTYITNRYDLWKAQSYLRHDSPQTTFDSYAGCVMDEATMQLWEPED
jgi:integrase